MGIVKLARRLHAEDLFDYILNESEQEKDRKAEVKIDKRLEGLLREFKRTLKDPGPDRLNFPNIYERMLQTGIKYNSKEIETFSLLIPKYQNFEGFNSYAGLFLSALITKSEDNDFIVHTKTLENPPILIGYRNSKNIVIKGNAGSYLGRSMKKGRIIAEGNVESNVGHNMEEGLIEIIGDSNTCAGWSMKGGKIIIRGSSKNFLGFYMTRGEIIVNSNVEGFTAPCMNGGEIHLNGDYGTIPKDIKGGNIYHKGKLIIKDGKAVPGAKVKWGP
jgi:hypothetical protein